MSEPSPDGLRAAARRIRAAVAQANDGGEWYTEAELNVILGRDSALIALMSPTVASDLADWLDWLASVTVESYPIDPDSKAAILAGTILAARH